MDELLIICKLISLKVCRSDSLGNRRQNVEQVELLVATTEQLEVSGGYQFSNPRLLDVWHIGVVDEVLQQLHHELLDVIALEDEILSQTGNIGVGGAPRCHHSIDHHDCLGRNDARNGLDVVLCETILLGGETRTCLQGVDAPSEVTLGDCNQLGEDLFVLERHIFSLADLVQTLSLGLNADGRESKLDTSGGQRVDDLADVVADDAESGGAGVGLDDAAEGCLGINCHGVCLVQDHYL